MIAASFGPPLVQKLTSLWLIRIIAFLLAAIGVLLWVEVLWASTQIELKPDALTGFLLACALGGVVGLVSSVLGVAGGELLIPILIFFGASIVVAGSASALISLSIIGAGLYRHWQLGTFPRGKGIHRIVGAMGIGSIFGAFLGSLAIAFVSATALKLLLGAVLVAAAAKTLLSVSHIERI